MSGREDLKARMLALTDNMTRQDQGTIAEMLDTAAKTAIRATVMLLWQAGYLTGEALLAGSILGVSGPQAVVTATKDVDMDAFFAAVDGAMDTVLGEAGDDESGAAPAAGTE